MPRKENRRQAGTEGGAGIVKGRREPWEGATESGMGDGPVAALRAGRGKSPPGSGAPGKSRVGSMMDQPASSGKAFT